MPSYSGVFTLQAQMQAIAAGNWTGYVPPIGSAFGGGYFAGQISTAGNGVADYNLVVGPVASAQNSSKQWKTASTSGDPTSVIDGPANSATMNSAVYPAAEFCEAVTTGGYSDWYMPAKNELEVCYYNLKPTTSASDTSSGINPNAVPARASNYTSGNPAQTSATAFQTGNAEAFTADTYWSSTESTAVGSTYAYRQSFYGGVQSARNKTQSIRVRAIRRVAV